MKRKSASLRSADSLKQENAVDLNHSLNSVLDDLGRAVNASIDRSVMGQSQPLGLICF